MAYKYLDFKYLFSQFSKNTTDMNILTIVRKISLLTALIFCFVVASLAQDAKTPNNSTKQPDNISKAAPIYNTSTDGKVQSADPARGSSMAVQSNTAKVSQNPSNTSTETPAKGSAAADNNKVNVVKSSSATVSPQFNARQKATAGTNNNLSPNNK